MNKNSSLNHTCWECKYHIVWIPKYRRQRLYGQLRRHLGEVLRGLARARESEVIEGHLMPDHAHMLISIPPKYSVAQVVGYVKGKSAIYIARTYMGRRRNFTGQHFWARGYHVSSMPGSCRQDKACLVATEKGNWPFLEMNPKNLIIEFKPAQYGTGLVE